MSDGGRFRIEVASSSGALAAVLAELHGVCFADSAQETWSANALSTLLGVPGTTCLVAMTPAGAAIGFAIGRAIAEDAEILTLCVSPAVRRQGIATALLAAVRQRLKPRRLLLEVAITNHGARRLYESLGFQEVGRRPDYYRRGAHAVDALVLAGEEHG